MLCLPRVKETAWEEEFPQGRTKVGGEGEEVSLPLPPTMFQPQQRQAPPLLPSRHKQRCRSGVTSSWLLLLLLCLFVVSDICRAARQSSRHPCKNKVLSSSSSLPALLFCRNRKQQQQQSSSSTPRHGRGGDGGRSSGRRVSSSNSGSNGRAPPAAGCPGRWAGGLLPASVLQLPGPVRQWVMLNETKLAIAGAMAGGFTNLLLHPIDTAKTLRQSSPSSYPTSLLAVLFQHARRYGVLSLWSGLAPAVLGSMPSSSLYFGVYEYMKRRLGGAGGPLAAAMQLSSSAKGQTEGGGAGAAWRRFTVHMFAAASGNTASSLVFVPKEVIKQQLQTIRTHGQGEPATLTYVVRTLVKERGLRGLYSGYRATLLRNIPSAVLRFALYEEFKLAIQRQRGEDGSKLKWLKDHNAHLIAGALAGALSSAVTTPFDVVKTRMAINLCPPGGDVMQCLVSVAKNEGMNGLYAGLAFRMIYSALFTAIGFSSFEYSKAMLGVQDYHNHKATTTNQQDDGKEAKKKPR